MPRIVLSFRIRDVGQVKVQCLSNATGVQRYRTEAAFQKPELERDGASARGNVSGDDIVVRRLPMQSLEYSKTSAA